MFYSAYFTLCIIATPLLLTRDLHVRLLRAFDKYSILKSKGRAVFLQQLCIRGLHGAIQLMSLFY